MRTYFLPLVFTIMLSNRLFSNCLIQGVSNFQTGTCFEGEQNFSNLISTQLEGVQLIFGELITVLDNSLDFFERVKRTHSVKWKVCILCTMHRNTSLITSRTMSIYDTPQVREQLHLRHHLHWVLCHLSERLLLHFTLIPSPCCPSCSFPTHSSHSSRIFLKIQLQSCHSSP